MRLWSFCAGNSLGGYLGGRACAGLSDRLAACVIYPARTELFGAYNVTAQYGIPVYGGIQYAAQQDPSLLPPGYAQAFSNLSSILDPLLLDCTPDTSAPQAFATPLEAKWPGASGWRGSCAPAPLNTCCRQALHCVSGLLRWPCG